MVCGDVLRSVAECGRLWWCGVRCGMVMSVGDYGVSVERCSEFASVVWCSISTLCWIVVVSLCVTSDGFHGI